MGPDLVFCVVDMSVTDSAATGRARRPGQKVDEPLPERELPAGFVMPAETATCTLLRKELV